MHHKILEFSLNANCKHSHFRFYKDVFSVFPWIFILWLTPQTIQSYLTFHYTDQPQDSESDKRGSTASSKITLKKRDTSYCYRLFTQHHTIVNNSSWRTAANLMLLLIMCTLHTGMRAQNCGNGGDCINRPFSWIFYAGAIRTAGHFVTHLFVIGWTEEFPNFPFLGLNQVRVLTSRAALQRLCPAPLVSASSWMIWQPERRS